MANVNAPFGFRPSRKIDGSIPNYQLVYREIAYNNSHTIAKGDPVYGLSTGYIDLRASGGAQPILGIFWGCKYLDPNTGFPTDFNSWTAPTLPSTTKVTAALIVDKNMIFQCRAGGSTTPITLADIGANFDHGGEGVPSPNNSMGFSTAYLIPSPASTATFPFKLWGVGDQIQGNDPTAAYDIVEVVMNFAELYYTTGNP